MSSESLPGDTSLPSSQSDIDALIALDDRSHQYSVEDFFKIPEKSDYKISPDGDFISYQGPFERRRNIFVQDKATGETIRITSERERDISGYAWANSRRLIFIKDSGGDENFKLFAVDRDGQNSKDLTPFDQVRIQLIDALRDQEDFMIIGMNKNNPMLFDPYRINVITGELVQIAVNDNPAEPLEGWMCDHAGKLRICMKTIEGVNQAVMYRDNEDQPFQEVIRTNFKDSISPVQFDADNSHVLYCLSNVNRDKTVLLKYDMRANVEVGEVIFAHDEYDVSGVHWSKKRQKLLAVSYTGWKSEFIYFDQAAESLSDRWKALLPEVEVRGVSVDYQEEVYIVRTFTDRSLGAYYIYDKAEDSLEKIADVSPWLDDDDLMPMKPMSYQSRDGVTIHGYLTLPKGYDGGSVPLVVNPHGGPWVRDSWGFNPEVQLMASRGYAVFQMNYRSSTGYGKAFWELGFKQWGKTMQDDITDGVQHLVDEGIVLSDKIAIYGGSYGGYATLAGICFTPELYACAIDFVGVSNLFTFMNTIPPYWKPYLDMLHEMVGDPTVDKARMTEASPVFHVDKIKTPLLVVQGANDPRVNIDESDQIVSSLRSRGIDVPYLVKYDEGHGFMKEENKFEFYQTMLGFLWKYLK